jgi:hypothetical protein
LIQPAIKTGAVIEYPYLWAREAEAQETEGRKPRPAAVGLRLSDDRVLLFPITSKEPTSEINVAEIPAEEKRRAGLDQDLRLWIILDECNLDVVGQSYYLTPDPPLGNFSKQFFSRILGQLDTSLLRQVNRRA